jgi:ABC-type sulfate/molybdate transport systems ATPase subunit
LAELGLAALAGRIGSVLSGGEQARVALARALVTQPDLLLLDEPFAALDVPAAADLRAQLAQALAQRRQTAVVVTHDMLDVVALAHRVLVLESGRLVDDGTPQQVFGRPRSGFAATLGANLEVLLASDIVTKKPRMSDAVSTAAVGLRRDDRPD